MNIEVIKLVTTSLVKKISNLITSPSERGLILEPISTLFRLSILSFKPKGTKISITENKIVINDNNYIQGISRWSSGDARTDLHNLFNPLDRLEKYDYSYLFNNNNYNNILKYAVNGLEKLKITYTDCSIVQHSINLYITKLKNIIKENESTENKDIEKGSFKDNSNCLGELEENDFKIENNLYRMFKNIWNNRQSNIICELLNEIYDLKNKNNLNDSFDNIENKLIEEEIFYLLESINNILISKDKYVENIIKNVSSGLN